MNVPNHYPELPPKEKMFRIVIWNMLKKMCQITILSSFNFWGKAQNSDLTHFLKDEAKVKKLSEIKPPLISKF